MVTLEKIKEKVARRIPPQHRPAPEPKPYVPPPAPVVEEPPKEMTPKQLILLSKIEQKKAQIISARERQRVDPTATYQVPQLKGKDVTQAEVEAYRKETGQPGYEPSYRLVTGQTLIAERKEQYERYIRGTSEYQRSLRDVPWGYTLKETDAGYVASRPSPEFLEKHRKDIFAPFGDQPGIKTYYGILGKQTGKPPSEVAYESLRYTFPEKKERLYKRMPVGYRELASYGRAAAEVATIPVTLPTRLTGIDIGITPRVGPTGVFGATISDVLTGTGKEWEYIKRYPAGGIAATVGEVVGGYGIAPVFGIAGKYIGKALKPPTFKFAAGIQRGFVGAYKRAYPYLPSSFRTAYGKLFIPARPGGFLPSKGVTGGIVSKFVYRSPLKFGLPFVKQPIFYATKPTVTSRIFGGFGWTGRPGRGAGILRGFDVTRAITYRRALIGLPKVTETGRIIYGTGATYRFIGSRAAERLLQPGVTTGYGVVTRTPESMFIRMGKVKVSEPFGFLKRDITFTQKFLGLGYKSLDEMMRSLKTIRVGDFLAKTGVPSRAVSKISGVVVSKTITPATWKGTIPTRTLLLHPSERTVSKGYLDFLDLLEPSYKPIVTPPGTGFAKWGYKYVTTPKEFADVFKGLAARGLQPGRSSIDFRRMLLRDMETGLRYRPETERVAYASLIDFMSGGRTAALQDMGLDVGKVSELSIDSLLGLKQEQRQAQMLESILGYRQVTDRQPYRPLRTAITPMVPFIPVPRLYGRGRVYSDLELWLRKYRERRRQIPNPWEVGAKMIKNVQKSLKKGLDIDIEKIIKIKI